MALSFDIADWHAWGPGLSDRHAWRAWARAVEPISPRQLPSEPDVSFLPAMQRRRLTPLARMCFAAGWPLVQGREHIPVVFASSHGDTPLTLGLLEAVATDSPISPTQFALSVHNAVVGQWSIHRSDTSESCAVAAGHDGMEHAFLEACGIMHDGAPEVLVLLAETNPASLYLPWIDDVPFPYAFGFRLTPGSTWALTTEASSGAVQQDIYKGKNPLAGIRSFLQDRSTWTRDCAPRFWRWNRSC